MWLDKVTFFIIAVFTQDVTAINNVVLKIQPDVVIRGHDATLVCSRSLESGERLYVVKWYRGASEFYRYTANNQEHPFQIFPGAMSQVVDSKRSDGHQVTLRNVTVNLEGNYTCEVTVEGARFGTRRDTKYFAITALPEKKPLLLTDKESYKPNDSLTVNCTTDKSIPAPTLNLFINNETLAAHATKLQQWEYGLQVSEIVASIVLSKDHFVNGSLKISCEAKIDNLYYDKVEKYIYDPTQITPGLNLTLSRLQDHSDGNDITKTDRVTSSQGYLNSSSPLLQLFLIVFFLLTSCVRAGELFDGETFFEYGTMEDNYGNVEVYGDPLNSLTG